MNLESYISGYVDGEGCFNVSFSKRDKMNTGWEVKASFSVSQNEDRSQVLRMMQQYFGCCTLRRDYHDKTLKLETRQILNLTEKIIPHFQKYPLLSDKKKDFELFVQVCNLIAAQQHLTIMGMRKIVGLAFQMNSSGRRRYAKKEILDSLAEKDIVSARSNTGNEHEVQTRMNSGTTGGLSQPIAR